MGSLLATPALLTLLACGGDGGRGAEAQRPADRSDAVGSVATADSTRETVTDSAVPPDSLVTTAPDTSRAARLARRVPRPDSVRALYVNAWAAGSRSRMADLIRIADATEINAFIIDIKESDTYLAYDGTRIPLALEIGADQRPATKWLPALVDTLNAHGIYSIARIVVF
ncbi:MAG TPA: putative glycoside hydrolase, partial [Gemmatimonadaceae bacterium]|nr:putative glycoside hydrolase [Gemmatimonadaceae bacterium]